ncbi:hypothetical protein EG832_12890 [bacterium]|nr:hypothetical protein [bacterium]
MNIFIKNAQREMRINDLEPYFLDDDKAPNFYHQRVVYGTLLLIFAAILWQVYDHNWSTKAVGSINQDLQRG